MPKPRGADSNNESAGGGGGGSRFGMPILDISGVPSILHEHTGGSQNWIFQGIFRTGSHRTEC